jgi:hypothetical protein
MPLAPGGRGDARDDAPVNAPPWTTHPDPLVVAWTVWGALLVALLVTYTRIAPTDLYHVSGEGLAGGLSRVIVQINFPIALVAIAILLVCLDSLTGAWPWWAGASIVLSAVTVWPGVVDDSDLDVRWINVVPAVGVAIAIAVTVVALRTERPEVGPLPLDPARWTLGIAAVLVSIPWFAADLGFYLPGRVFIMEEALADDRAGEIAVHYGHHHGFDGTLLLLTALILTRVRVRRPGLGIATRAYLSLLFAYGAVNMVQDAWNEQLVKRGWVDWWMPSAVHPGLNAMWAVVLAVAAATGALLAWESQR